MTEFAHPEVLVSTSWVAENGGSENVVVVEVDVDTNAYDEGHIPGSIGWNWRTQLCDTVQRDIVGKNDLESLLGSSGITSGAGVSDLTRIRAGLGASRSFEYGSLPLHNRLREMLEEFRRADCVIHAVDISGLESAENRGEQQR